MNTPECNGADIYTEEGRPCVSITSIHKEGDQLRMEGKLMGSWDSTMYMAPEMAVRMGKLMLNRSVITFVISLPFILRRRKKAIEN